MAQRIQLDVPNRRASVAVSIHRLRMRIERDPRFPERIRTVRVRAKGYVFPPGPDERGLDDSPGRHVAIDPATNGVRPRPIFC